MAGWEAVNVALLGGPTDGPEPRPGGSLVVERLGEFPKPDPFGLRFPRPLQRHGCLLVLRTIAYASSFAHSEEVAPRTSLSPSRFGRRPT